MNEVYAEQSVIGSLLLSDGEAMAEIPAELDASMFADGIYASAFAIFQKAYEKSEKVGLAVIKQRLVAQNNGIPESHIENKLRETLTGGYSSGALQTDAAEVITAYKSRRLNEVLNKTNVTPDNLSAAMDYLSIEIDRLSNQNDKRVKSLPQIVAENKDNYFRDREGQRIDLEFETLNDLLGGIEGGDVIVIGARPAVGKSAFATQLTNHFSTLGKKIGYFNLEMTEKQVYERFVSAVSGIGLQRIKRALAYTGDERERFDRANKILAEKDIIDVATGSQSVSNIRNIVKKRGYDIIIVDYLQLLKPEGTYRGNRFAEVGDISHKLKALATDFGIPVIVLSQLNRASMQRENSEPSMSELRESGDIEQDASVIILLWNLDEDGLKKGCKIAKNRQGKIGKVEMRFNGDLMKFEEISDRDGFVKMDDETPFTV